MLIPAKKKHESRITIMPRQRSLSITPTFSTDRDLLLSHNPSALAATVDEAKSALSMVDIYRDEGFQRRAKLDTIQEWGMFLETCAEPNNEINLEKALKKCYAVAYSMPSSPNVKLSSQMKDTPFECF